MNNTKIQYNDFFPDFSILLKKYPELQKYITKADPTTGQYIIDWTNRDLSLIITKSILNYYFNIVHYSIPENFLIPPVPSRLNYINLINNLLRSNIITNSITGIDIGTGANLIYPLLGNFLYGWKFTCSEINSEAFDNAKQIIINNNLSKDIKIIKQKRKENILVGILNREIKYTFTICNPPYFDYETEIKEDNKNKKDFEYNFDEVYYKGGELKFFENFFKESFGYYNNVFLFTILIGKKINAENILDKISNDEKIKIKGMKKISSGSVVRYVMFWSFFDSFEKFYEEKFFSYEYNEYRPIFTNKND